MVKTKTAQTNQRNMSAKGKTGITGAKKPEALPSHVLHEQVCSECSKYLTALPVIQKKNGEIICGRHGDSEVGVKSLFNTVIANYSFKCANHFEGCQEILDTSTSEQHEQKCKFQLHECLFCSFVGNWAQILQHSSVKHPLSVKKDCKISFKIGTESFQKFLFPINNTIYVFTVHITYEKYRLVIYAAAKNDFEIKDCVLKFSKYSVHNDNETSIMEFISFDSRSKSYFEKDMEELIFQFGIDSIVSCQVTFKKVNLANREQILEKRFALYNTQMQSLIDREKALVKFSLDIEDNKKVLSDFSNIFKRLSHTLFKCCQCKKFGTKTLYFCPQNHCYCDKCLSNTCNICNDICEFTRILDFDKIVVSCDHCKKSIGLASYADHTTSCSHRAYKCPLSNCPDTVFSRQGLIDHWHGSPLLINSGSIEFDKYGNYKRYWLIGNELYCVVVKFDAQNLQILIKGNNTLNETYIPKFTFHKYCTQYKQWYDSPGIHRIDGILIHIGSSLLSSGYCAKQLRVSVS